MLPNADTCYTQYTKDMPHIIEINPNVLGGKPVIKGTRIPIARILALISMDYTLLDLKKEFPQLAFLAKKDLNDILSYYQSKFSYR